MLCLKQSRSYQNSLAYIQNVKKTAQVIFCFSSFDTNWKFKIPWHFPDIFENIHFSLTQHKIPWQFPDLEIFLISLTFPWRVWTLSYVHSSRTTDEALLHYFVLPSEKQNASLALPTSNSS